MTKPNSPTFEMSLHHLLSLLKKEADFFLHLETAGGLVTVTPNDDGSLTISSGSTGFTDRVNHILFSEYHPITPTL